MTHYRLPPAQPRPAPAAPWWRVAWAEATRDLTRRIVARKFRLRLRAHRLEVLASVKASMEESLARVSRWNIDNAPANPAPMPLPGSGRSVLV